ncbi:hypothetical protein DFP72DRAFT_1076931 [Ephemerocybe angulata]|uniref:Histone H2A/H2B/H3 domain-containing protein n=1 Tax=Ephemerocybe angulata TaxID=980116 RepID=A0A8H6HEX9_9AGAR|nr:hypothetical protein DFP72DRAFT_1076931 [Tulosesus angulatus]
MAQLEGSFGARCARLNHPQVDRRNGPRKQLASRHQHNPALREIRRYLKSTELPFQRFVHEIAQDF